LRIKLRPDHVKRRGGEARKNQWNTLFYVVKKYSDYGSEKRIQSKGFGGKLCGNPEAAF
jgi:hypothetical protein